MQSTRVALLGFAAAIATAAGACQTGGGTSSQNRGSCYVLIECAAELEPAVWDSYMDTYGPLGSCWEAGVAQWQSCRDQCLAALEVLNETASETCGACTVPADCAEYGPTAYCLQGYCAGGSPPDDSSGEGDTFSTLTTLSTGDGDDADAEDDTTSDDGDGDPPANCGWDDANGYYACGFEGPDPSGNLPIECSSGLAEGDPCGIVTGAGCCDENGDNWYCTQEGTLFVEDC